MNARHFSYAIRRCVLKNYSVRCDFIVALQDEQIAGDEVEVVAGNNWVGFCRMNGCNSVKHSALSVVENGVPGASVDETDRVCDSSNGNDVYHVVQSVIGINNSSSSAVRSCEDQPLASYSVYLDYGVLSLVFLPVGKHLY
jgi:hypothetical protein